jgi:hypothetical protein
MRAWNIFGIATLAVLVLISLLAAFVWLRKRYLAKQKVLRTPLTIFQENLGLIEKDFLRHSSLDNAKGKKFSFSLTNAVRTYLSAESGEKLLDLTDFELIQAIHSHSRLAPTEQLVKEILEATLKPRYSDSLLEINMAIELLNNAKKIYLPPLTKEGKES